jgi:hypothetical protein
MAKTATAEDDSNLVDDVSEEVVLEVEESVPADSEEIIPDEEGKQPIRKKVAALKARHRLEDYFEMKRIQDELDYLDDEKKRKAELLQKVVQNEKHYEKPEKPVKAAKAAKRVVQPQSPPEIQVLTPAPVKVTPKKQPKKAPVIKHKHKMAKPKPKAKPKAKPKSKKKAKK